MKSLILLIIGLVTINSFGQTTFDPDVQLEWEIPFTFPQQAMTIVPDELGRPYIYVAGADQRLRIYDVSGVTPVSAGTIPNSQLQNLSLMNLRQYGNYLYLALGTHFNDIEFSSLGIIDISDPANPVVSDIWSDSHTSGAGDVVVEGDYAYLAAMQNGLIVLDISDKQQITYVSRFMPDPSYPYGGSIDTAKYNIRGLEVVDGIVYTCYDAGGLRIINCTDKLNPVETGRFSNPVMHDPFNLPRAYNNLVFHDTLLYVSVDYCGLEILNIKDTSQITMVGWWNPYGCPTNNWFTSPVHANELEYEENCQLVFVSTGKSEMKVLNVADPTQPAVVDSFGSTTDTTGTWGIGMRDDRIYLGYIFVPLGIPFSSNWGGVKQLSWDNGCAVGMALDTENALFGLYPNPTQNEFSIQLKNPGAARVEIYDLTGKLHLIREFSGNKTLIKGLQPGHYLIRIIQDGVQSQRKLLII